MMLNSGASVMASHGNTDMTWWSNASDAAKWIGASCSNNMFGHRCIVIRPVLMVYGEAQMVMLKIVEVGLKEPGNFPCHMN